MMKRIFALCCALLLLVGTAACGKGGNATDTEAVNAALLKLEDCTSCVVLQVTEIDETLVEEGLTYTHTGTTRTEITLISSPRFKMKNETTAQANYDGQEMSQHTISCIVPQDGGYCEYYFDGTSWYTVFAEDESAVPTIGVMDLAAMFMLEVESFGKAGTETLDSGRAHRYDAHLSGTALVSFLENNGYLSSITSMSENQQNKIKTNLAEDLESLVLSVWVDAESGFPVRFELDLSVLLVELEKIINETLGNLTSESQWTLDKYTMTMILSSLNQVEDIVIPPEAENAVPYDTSSLG